MNVQFILLALASAAACCAALDHVCPEINDPEHVVHHSHPTDCSKYLTCDWGKLVEQSCPPGLLWNDNNKLCDFPENVHCESQVPQTSTQVPQTSTQVPQTSTQVPHTSTVTPSTGKCPEHFNPDQPAYLPHEDCTKFYVCIADGEPLEIECSGGLHWNPIKHLCDNPADAGCVPATSATTPTFSTSGTTTSENDRCPEVYDQNHQVYFPHADCTKYYICTYEGNKLEQSCPPGQHWAQHLNYCDVPQVAQCQ